jgi:type I restriction enzyme S subunit
MTAFNNIRLKFTSAVPLKYGANAAAEFDDPSWPRFVRITDVDANGQLREDTFRSLPPEIAEPFRLQVGDILLARSGATVGKSFIYEKSWGDACYAGYLIRLRTSDKYFSRYIYWCLQSSEYWADIDSNLIQSTIQNVSADRYASFRVPSPPLAAQQRIARFLDEKISRIDGLLDKKRTLLDRLSEKRQVFITRAVTKGLKPNVPMKPSGIEWLGDVPVHWVVSALGYRYEVQLGRMLNAERSDGDHLKPYLRVYDVQWGKITVNDLPLMDFPPDAQIRYRLQPGDLLVNEGGSYVGRSAIWRGELEECYYQKALHRLRPFHSTTDTAEFLYFVMEMATKNGVFVAGGNQTTIDHLTAEQLRHYHFAFPPLEEQERISEALSSIFSRHERLVQTVQRSINRLEELRSATITAAVSGQIPELQ